MRNDELLFYKFDWFSVVESQKAQVRKQASSFEADSFEKAPLDELAQQLAERLSLEPPVIFPEQIEVSQREVQIDVGGSHDPYGFRSGAHYVQGTAIDIHIPFSGDPEMFNVKPSTSDFNPPRGEIRHNHIRFTISGTNLKPEEVQGEIDRFVKSVNEYLGYQAGSIGNLSQELHQIAYQVLEQRKAKLEADKDLVSKLGYKTR